MGALAKVAVVVLGIAFMTFVTFFGRLPALRHTPIAWLHRVLWVHIPNALLAVDQKVSSGRVTSYAARFGRYMWYDRHPTVLIFFILLLSVGEYLYLPVVWPQIGLFQKVTSTLAVLLPYALLYLSVTTDPGTITPANHAQSMALYPYDLTLFYPGSECKTCHLLKPARSKHCSVCNRCVSKADHHCIFINGCVGANNQRWFVLLLLSTAVLTSYGAGLGLWLMVAQMRARYPHWALLPGQANAGAGMEMREYLVVWSWALQRNLQLGAVTLLALLTSPLVWGLLGYTMWLIYCGTTTNESMKWSDLQADMDDGYAFQRRVSSDAPRDLRVEPARTRWPVGTQQVVMRTLDVKSLQLDRLPGEGDFKPVGSLRDLENLYDLGFWDNLVDVFLPGYDFRARQTSRRGDSTPGSLWKRRARRRSEYTNRAHGRHLSDGQA